jgi:hypothetical protein
VGSGPRQGRGLLRSRRLGHVAVRSLGRGRGALRRRHLGEWRLLPDPRGAPGRRAPPPPGRRRPGVRLSGRGHQPLVLAARARRGSGRGGPPPSS